jgi:hypothetical protein
MFWNPVKHIKDEWSSTNTVWSKTAVVLFYAFVWFFIFANIYQSFVPMSMGYECSVEKNADAISEAWIEAYVRLWALSLVFWALYVQAAGATLMNATVFLVMMAVMGVWFIVIFDTGSALHKVGDKDTEACISFILSTGWIYMTPLVVVVVCLLLDKQFGPRGTASETEPLV